VQKLKDIFPFEPTSIQEEAMGRLSKFVQYTQKPALFILKGFAPIVCKMVISSFIN
jgi:hypothetical protein